MDSQRIDKHFPRRVQERMKATGIGVAELARLLGFTSHTPVSQAITAAKPRPVSWDRLVQYARQLGCTPEWLARGEGAAPAAPSAMPMVVHAFGTESPELKTLGERALYVRATTGLTQPDFPRRLCNTGPQVSRQAIRKIEADEVADPSCKIMCAYEEFTGYRVRWLLWGRGDQRNVPAASAKHSELTDIPALAQAIEALRDAERVPQVASMPAEARAAMLAGFYKRLA